MELKINFTISQKTKNNWQRITNLLADLMQVEAGFITQITGGKVKILMAGSNEEVEIVEGDEIDLAEIYCHEAVKKQEMVEINDAREIEKWQDSVELDMGFISYLGGPIFYPSNQEVFGTICVVDSEPRSFSQKEKNLLKEFKLSIENQLENTMLNNKLGRQVEFIQSSLDSLSAHIAVIDEDGTIRYTNGAWDDFARDNDLAPEQAGEGINYLQITEQVKIEGAEKAEDALQGIKSVISGKKEAFTLEYPCHSPQEERWFKMRVTPFKGEAPFAAVVAHENITERKKMEEKLKRTNQKLNSEYEKAEMLHNNMLPSELPHTEELEMAAYYKPAYRLGGDFYDFYDYRETEKQIIFYMSDVSGHDLSSSMLNVFLKDAINTFFRDPTCFANEIQPIINPTEIIEFIEESFRELNIPAEYFISLLAGVINIEKNNIRVCNAGIHCLPILLKKNKIIQIENSRPPITSMEGVNFNYEETVIDLQPGDTLFAYTDGLIEQEIESKDEVGSREFFGEERLLEILEKNKDNHSDEIIAAVNDRFEEEKSDLEIQDDLTYVVIQRQRKN